MNPGPNILPQLALSLNLVTELTFSLSFRFVLGQLNYHRFMFGDRIVCQMTLVNLHWLLLIYLYCIFQMGVELPNCVP
jgi:hypothetical protein